MKFRIKSLAVTAVAALGLCAAMPSMATPATDALGECMARSTTADDDVVLVRWVFVMMGRHHSVADLSTVTPAQQEQVDRKMGAVFERLLAKDCADETRAAMAESKDDAIGDAFGTLFKKAFGNLTDDPAFMASAQNFIKYVDMNKIVQAMIAKPVKK